MILIVHVYFYNTEPDFQVGRDLIEDENAETDRVKLAIYIYYAKAIGLGLSVASVVLYACFQVFYFYCNLKKPIYLVTDIVKMH